MSHETTKFFAYSTAVFLSRLLQNDTIGFQIPVRSFVYASASIQARILLVFLFGSQFLQILHRNTVGIAMNFDPDLCLGKKKKKKKKKKTVATPPSAWFFMPRHQKVAGYYVIPSEILSVRPSVRLSVCPSVRPSVRQRPPPFLYRQLLLQF